MSVMDAFKDKGWYLLLGIILIISFFITSNVIVREELIFGDDGFYASRGQSIAENLEISRNAFGETDLRGHRPLTREPMTFILLGFFYTIAGEFGMKLLVPLVSIISASLLFLLVKEMYSKRAGLFAALLYLTIPTTITHTVFLYVEHVAVMYLIGSFYFLYLYFKKQNMIHLVMTGVMFGLSALTAQNVMIVPLIFAILLFIYKIDWKSWFKEIGILFLITMLMVGPWMAHNYNVGNGLGFDSHRVLEPLGIDLRQETDYSDQLPDVDTEGLQPRERERTHVHQIGYIEYIDFAYSLPIFILAMLGFSFHLVEKKRKHYIPILWAVFMFAVLYAMLWDRSMDMISRNTFYVVPPLMLAAGLACEKIYEYLNEMKSIGKTMAIMFLAILLIFSFSSALTKAEQLRENKEFSDAFFNACEWINNNTPEDSVLHYIFRYRSDYHCQRKSIGNSYTGMPDAIVSADDTTYETFQVLGVDYVMLHNQLIGFEATPETHTEQFIQHIMNDPRYQEVYQFPEGCNIADIQRECITIYEVLDEDEVGEEEMEMDLEDMIETVPEDEETETVNGEPDEEMEGEPEIVLN